MVLGATARALVILRRAGHSRPTKHRDAALHDRTQSDAGSARGGGNVPGGITTLWPNSGVVAGVSSLPGEVVRVTYKSATADPLEVTVTSQFRDLRGRTLTVRVSTILTGV